MNENQMPQFRSGLNPVGSLPGHSLGSPMASKKQTATLMKAFKSVQKPGAKGKSKPKRGGKSHGRFKTIARDMTARFKHNQNWTE